MRISQPKTESKPTTLISVTDGRRAIGTILRRGKKGAEAFDADDRSLGLFPTVDQAAAAVWKAREQP